jgi:hypothetical protein
VIGAVATRRPRTAFLPGAEILVALIVGAAVGAAVISEIPRFVPVFILLPLVAVTVLAEGIETQG